MTRYVRIEYTVRPDVDLEELAGAIGEFVAGIAAHHPEHRYTSYRHADDPRRYVHVGELVADVVPALQREPFFQRFTAYLRERCVTGPDVTPLQPVASTTTISRSTRRPGG